ncbi:MAG: hypothetical protein RIR48_1577 [Bacteroidota bacterium]|jgi:hypothetical protein
MERDVNVLDKMLNSKLFLDKYPFISKVFVYQYMNKIDIVLSPSEMEPYWLIKDEIFTFIRELARMAGVETRFDVYP